MGYLAVCSQEPRLTCRCKDLPAADDDPVMAAPHPAGYLLQLVLRLTTRHLPHGRHTAWVLQPEHTARGRSPEPQSR